VLPKSTDQVRAIPWHESNLLWGSLGLFGAVVFTVVAAMMHDPRWLLILALPFGIMAVWSLLKGLGWRPWTYIPGAILVGFILLEVSTLLNPKILEQGRPNFAISAPETMKTPPELKAQLGTEYSTRVIIRNTGKHIATNLYNKHITVDQDFKIKPQIVDASKGNDIAVGDSGVYNFGINFPFGELLPTYFVFAVKYQDKEVPSPKIFCQIWYFKQVGGTNEEPPLHFNDATIPERENIFNHLKEELKDYQE
jgi:hypothetical protein